MSNNQLKKTILYTSPENKQIIENFLNFNYIVNNQTASGTIEAFILDSILPSNVDARIWMRELFYDTSRMGKIMSYIYSYLAGGIMGQSRHSINLDLIKFSRSCLIYGFNDNIDKESHYFFSCYDSIIQLFENHYNQIINTPYEDRISDYTHVTYNLENRIHGLKETRNSKEFFYATDFTHYILSTLIKHWDLVSSNTMTFRFLSSLARIQCWNPSPERVLELNSILKNITKDWN